MKKLCCLGLFLAIVFFACTDRDDNLTSPQIRIKNQTESTFLLLEIEPDSLFYENVPPNGFSEYLAFENALEAMPFTIETDSMAFSFTPAIPIFEPLPIGLYTYEVDINEEGEVELVFRID